VVYDPNNGTYEIIHPNEDGSYWRRRQKNKFVRIREKQRESVVKEWASKQSFIASSLSSSSRTN